MYRVLDMHEGVTIVRGQFADEKAARDYAAELRWMYRHDTRSITVERVAFADVIEEYRIERQKLGQMWAGDGQAFYAADAHLRMRLGLELTQINNEALDADRRPVPEQGDALPF